MDTSATPEIGEVFNGLYSDPNHLEGYRVITMTDTFENGQRVGTCDGSDTGKIKEYSLTALAGRDGEKDTIIVDFSAKGGPANLHGSWHKDGESKGIVWSDKNFWTMVDQDK